METNNSWFALEIAVKSEASEAIEFALNELEALGTEINHLGKDKSKETLCVVGYFNVKPGEESLQTELTEALRIYNFDQTAVQNLTWREVENKDWLAEWKKHWQPTKTGRFIIAPTWSEVDENGALQQQIVIRIDPEMAFGTGTHETTRLCLSAIEENYTKEMSFLDVGTGTGILAIAAAKSQIAAQTSNFKDNSSIFGFISACDTDENSVEIAVKNVELNNVAENIDFHVGSIDRKTSEFDFVCANLTADVILPILPILVEKAKQKLVLSGILKEQESLVADKLRELLISNFKVQTDGEWISILIDK